METGEPTLIGSMPGALWFLGEIVFKWVPATVIAIIHTSSTSPFATLNEPVAAWDVPRLLAQASGAQGFENLLKGWYVYTVIALLLSIPFLAVAVYSTIRVMQIRRREAQGFRAAQKTAVSEEIPRTQRRWNRILEQANSSNPESWRLAILEADIMLNELLDLQGYKGETIADKMKQVDRAQFNSIDDAWEAHKIRNRIAHEGTTMSLSSRELREVIARYERVFKEFHYVT